MAKSRTHLAVVRTGLSFIAIGIVFLRLFSREAENGSWLPLDPFQRGYCCPP